MEEKNQDKQEQQPADQDIRAVLTQGQALLLGIYGAQALLAGAVALSKIELAVAQAEAVTDIHAMRDYVIASQRDYTPAGITAK